MPWETNETMDLRYKFILLAKERGANIAELSREFGINRKTGYKWLERYEEQGVDGLRDQSRRPLRSPFETPGEAVIEVVKVRTLKPTWGGKKIHAYLERHYNGEIPSRTTIERILERSGLVERRRRRRARRNSIDESVIVPEKCNDVWTTDFKGWWHTKDKNRVEPLTIRDEYSKFIIDIRGMATTQQKFVKECFREAFERYGLPRYIRSDNGTPFVSPHGLCGLTQLSVWWIKLGIHPNRIPPASPQKNGGHERMHRDMKAELQKYAGKDLPHQQQLFNIWREEFNTVRPHEALQQKTPSEIYKRSLRKYDPKEPDFEYPCGWEVRKVNGIAETNWKCRKIYLSKALIGEYVGIEELDDSKIRFWFGDYPLCIVDSLQMKGQQRIYSR